MDAAAQGPAKAAEPELCQDGEGEHQNCDPGEDGGLGGEDALHRGVEQLHPQQENQHRHPHTGKIFVPGVAEGVPGVGGPGRQAEGRQGDHRAAGIREVVHPIGGDGNAAGDGPHQELPRRKEKIHHNPHDAPQAAVTPPHLRVLRLFPAWDKPPNQKFGHLGTSFQDRTSHTIFQ